jgi:hypothetical protein
MSIDEVSVERFVIGKSLVAAVRTLQSPGARIAKPKRITPSRWVLQGHFNQNCHLFFYHDSLKITFAIYYVPKGKAAHRSQRLRTRVITVTEVTSDNS